MGEDVGAGGRARVAPSMALLTTLVTAAAVLLVAVPTGASAAGSVTCTVTRVIPGKPVPAASSPPVPGDWVALVLTEPDTRTPIDVRVDVDLTHPDLANLGMHVYAPGGGRTQLFNYNETSGLGNGQYAFSDSATTPFSGLGPAPGTYRSRTALANLSGQPAKGNWIVWVLQASPSTGEVRQVTITYTFTGCPQPDADRDGVPDLDDNCPSVANPDQANSDDDSVGNACDIDDDNDGTDDVDDPCPTVAAAGGCPGAARSVRLRRVAGSKVRGTVRSPVSRCRADRVVLSRVRAGKDPVVARGRSNAKGAFELRLPRRPGRYYAAVQPRTVAGIATCKAASSKKIAVRR